MATPKKVPFLHEVEQQIRLLAGPLNVTLAKVSNNKSTPYPMWQKPNGFSAEEVIGIGPNLLEWCGGGTSLLNILDVDGKAVQCQVYYPTDIYPEKVPQSMAHNLRQQPVAAPAPAPVQAQVIPIQQQVQQVPVQVYQTPMAAVAGGSPQMSDFGSVPSGVPVRGNTTGYTVQQQPQQIAPGPWSAPPPEVRVVERSRGEEDRVKAAEDDARREREERLKLEAKVERERLEAQYQKQLDGLREEVRRSNEKPAGPDEHLRGVADTVKELAAEIRTLKEGKREDGMAQVLTVMMQMQQQSQQQMMQMLAALNTKPQGMDPTVQVLIESMRSDREAARERERSEREARREEALVRREEAREREKSAIGPREFIDMTEKLRSSSGVDVMMKSVTEVFGTMFGMMKQQVEMVQTLNGNQGPHPAVELVGNALVGVQEMAKQYFQSKQTVEVAQAQARAVEAQAQARVAMGPQAQPPQAQQAAQAAPSNVVPLRPQQPGVPEAPPPQVQMTAEEQQLFGLPVVLQKVEELRLIVAQGKATPENVVNWIRIAHGQLKQAGIAQHVKAFGLYEQGIFDDFVRALLPNAPQPFIIELVNTLTKAASNPTAPIGPTTTEPTPTSKKQVENDDEEEDDEDDEI